jgi:hypothetical protein
MMFHALAGAVRGSLSLALYIFEHRVLVHTLAYIGGRQGGGSFIKIKGTWLRQLYISVYGPAKNLNTVG